MLDAVLLEKKGIHTVTIVWDTFEKAARTAARVQGVPDLKLVVIPHRTGGQTAGDQRAKADAVVPRIAELLLGE